MKWNIITDSSCDMFGFDKEHENIVFSSVPFTISVGDENFVDDRNLDVDGMIDSMDACAEASHTACPSPHAWQEKFEQEGNVIAITISSKLSGSYNSACVAKDMVLEEQPDKKIAVIDSRSAGSELVLLVKKICELIESGADFETVVEKAELYSRHTHVVFALSSFNNLVKNGRMSKIVGFVANKLDRDKAEDTRQQESARCDNRGYERARLQLRQSRHQPLPQRGVRRERQVGYPVRLG